MDDESVGILAALFGGVFMLIWFAVFALVIASLWKLYDKAGKPGWAAIVPIYQVIVMLEIVGRPIWWIILLFVPIANMVVGIILAIDLARSFGKDIGFAIGMILLGFIFLPMLAFGDAKYIGPSVAAAPAPQVA